MLAPNSSSFVAMSALIARETVTSVTTVLTAMTRPRIRKIILAFRLRRLLMEISCSLMASYPSLPLSYDLLVDLDFITDHGVCNGIGGILAARPAHGLEVIDLPCCAARVADNILPFHMKPLRVAGFAHANCCDDLSFPGNVC